MPLIDILLFASVFSPICLFIHVLMTEEGMIGFHVGNFLELWLPEWIVKPLFICPVCMASIWGISAWLIIGGSLLWLIPAVFCLGGFNAVLSKVYYFKNEITFHNNGFTDSEENYINDCKKNNYYP